MTEDVFEVVDQDLPPVCLQLISQGADKCRANRASLGCQVGQEHLESPLYTSRHTINVIVFFQYLIDTVTAMTHIKKAIEVWEIKSMGDLSQHVQVQLFVGG